MHLVGYAKNYITMHGPANVKLTDIFLVLYLGQCVYRFSDTFVWNHATDQ